MVSQKIWKEFQKYVKQYEEINGVQAIDGLRRLARIFAATKSPLDNKKAQPIYYRLFLSIFYLRNDPEINELPADFNRDNHYDPDGLYPDDNDIKKKLKTFNKRIEKGALEYLRIINETQNT
jgi:hypothetical protein